MRFSTRTAPQNSILTHEAAGGLYTLKKPEGSRNIGFLMTGKISDLDAEERTDGHTP
jgi:hypothetical protein